jgi:homoserine dehydrogenase
MHHLVLKHRKTGEHMPHYNLALLGFGNVGRALAILLRRKESELQGRYGITYRVSGIATRHHGAAINPAGLDYARAVELVEKGESLAALSKIPVQDNLHFLRSCEANVLFENTPVNHQTGQPAIDHLHLALELGMHAITANKGPVVHAYRDLSDFAKAQNKKFYFESTVMDGAPIFSLFRSALPGADLLGFRGILNSTTNLILGRMETGESFDEAVKYAQSAGLAETDPAADVDGWDAAIKVAALITVLMDIPFSPQQVDRTGIRRITPEMVAQAKTHGSRWKLVCSAERDGNSVKGRVAPELVGASSPLYGVEGSSSMVEFQTDTLSHLSIFEGNPGPETTAYGLLADFINAVRSVV